MIPHVHHPAASVLAWLLRLGLAGLFIYAGAVKAGNPMAFWKDVQAYRLLPENAALAVAFYLPWLEIFCGLALLTPWLCRPSLAILTGLMIVFITALASGWLRGIDLTCGCFGQPTSTSAGTAYAWLLGRDLAIIVALGAAMSLTHAGRLERKREAKGKRNASCVA